MSVNYNYIKFILLILLLSVNCREDFLDTKPTGVASEHTLATEEGIQTLLTGAYHGLLGSGHQSGGWFGQWAWAASPSNWIFGSVRSDDATRGSDAGDESMLPTIEYLTFDARNDFIYAKWAAHYDAIARCNEVLKVLPAVKDLSEKKASTIKAEALFLRAWFHFELKRVFNHIPFITEKDNPGEVTNTTDAWAKIIGDLLYAVENLPGTRAEHGRADSYAARAVLARVYMFTGEFSLARIQLDEIINSGRFSLMDHYEDNYRIATRNNKESIFEIQYAVNDGSPESANGSYGDALNYPYYIDGVLFCCGFFQPTQNLVNAFKVDEAGLPLFDTFNDTYMGNDMGIPSDSVFVQDTVTAVDPRLDHTVGRRGVPYLDWGIMKGSDWIRNQSYGGPYLNKKNMFLKSEKGIYSTNTGWATGVNANNYRAYRYGHILLWRAEVAIRENTATDLEYARQLINQIRARAAKSLVMGRCRTYKLPKGVAPEVDYSLPAAKYRIGLYPSSGWTYNYALRALQWELRLEFAMEGQRFYDLVRWGIAAETINQYREDDKNFRYLHRYTHEFVAGKHEYMPIPQQELNMLPGILKQNPGY